jgi:undecaprenyl pyrophosphate phosphatase UppP
MSFSKTKAAQALFYLNALIWLGFGLYTLVNMMGRYPGGAITVYVIGFMMLGNVCAMCLSGILLGWQNKWFYYFAVFVLVSNIVLAVTDQFGFFDLATFILDLVIFRLLISIRKNYLSHEANT